MSIFNRNSGSDSMDKAYDTMIFNDIDNEDSEEETEDNGYIYTDSRGRKLRYPPGDWRNG